MIMPRREQPPPHSFPAGSVRLVPGLFCGFDVNTGIPAARYREQVMGESHEATEADESKDPSLDLRPSVHLAEG